MIKNVILMILAFLTAIIIGIAFAAIRHADGAERASNGVGVIRAQMPYKIPASCLQNCQPELAPPNVMAYN